MVQIHIFISYFNDTVFRIKRASIRLTCILRVKTDKEGFAIPGNIIPNPKIFIFQRLLLLRVETETGHIVRAWIANESKVGDTYACVTKHLILFVDEENNTLHEIPLQLTAKGCFQFEFDRQICEFGG